MVSITVTVPVCEIGEYPEEYTPVAVAHSNKLTKEQREAIIRYADQRDAYVRGEWNMLDPEERDWLYKRMELEKENMGW